jgi:hypothetical protein
MSASALTPRVRFLTVCDEAVRSEIEEGVFTLEGVRYQILARSFPCLRELSVYLLLSYPRKASFKGRVHVRDDEEDKNIRLKRFDAEFDEDTHLVAVDVDLGKCAFPAPKVYWIKVDFLSHEGVNVLKCELPFLVLEEQE